MKFYWDFPPRIFQYQTGLMFCFLAISNSGLQRDKKRIFQTTGLLDLSPFNGNMTFPKYMGLHLLGSHTFASSRSTVVRCNISVSQRNIDPKTILYGLLPYRTSVFRAKVNSRKCPFADMGLHKCLSWKFISRGSVPKVTMLNFIFI